MGETQDTNETMPQEQSPEKSLKCRRNGLWNIFEGVDNTVLEKLGLSEDVVHQIVTEADQSVTQHLVSTINDEVVVDSSLMKESGGGGGGGGGVGGVGGCRCRKARILRSFSATVGEEVKAAQQNKHRRNAVGNLFDVLTPSQKILLVEHLQEQLEKLRCLCPEEEKDLKVAPVSGDFGKSPTPATTSTATTTTNGDIFLALSELSSSSSSSSSSVVTQSSGGVTSSSPKEEVACH